jgi:hypothetical protein
MTTSPTIALNKLGSGSGASVNKSIVFSPDGYLYIAGTRSPAFGELPNNGTDGYLSKITVSGDLIWSLPLTSSRNDSANSVSIGLDGSIYVSGFTQGTLDGQTVRRQRV